MSQTPIPTAELEVVKQLKGVSIVFDVGARTDIEYLSIFPKAEFHLFEPHAPFFEELKGLVGKKKKVHLNNIGLGNRVGKLMYSVGVQGFAGGEATSTGEIPYQIGTIDSYVNKHKVERIDFLKIDTEGFDYKVLRGAKRTLSKIKYIQYEHWNDKEQFHKLLEPRFHLEYIGYRNVLCINKKLVKKTELNKLVDFLIEGKYKELG